MVNQQESIRDPGKVAAGQSWRSGRLFLTPFAFYRLTFQARTAEPGYWGVYPFDAAGVQMRADTHASVYASSDWLGHETAFRGLADAVAFELGFRGLRGDMEIRDVRITPITTADFVQWAAALNATLPPVTFTPPPGRHQLIPRTIARLRGGETVRIVMLGDSITQDTYLSSYDVFVEQDYPGADLLLVPSVDGGKGCWHYIDPAMYRKHVIDYRPELLMIGTNSERDGSGPVREMIGRVRRELDCEIMVVSGPMGIDHRGEGDDTDLREGRAAVTRRRAFAAELQAMCQSLYENPPSCR